MFFYKKILYTNNMTLTLLNIFNGISTGSKQQNSCPDDNLLNFAGSNVQYWRLKKQTNFAFCLQLQLARNFRRISQITRHYYQPQINGTFGDKVDKDWTLGAILPADITTSFKICRLIDKFRLHSVLYTIRNILHYL